MMAARELTISEQDQLLSETMKRDAPRLRKFVQKRVLDLNDAEDVLQDVFYELVEAYRLMKPAEQVTAWLYRVARNRITDLFRRRRTVSLNAALDEDEDVSSFEDLLPAPEDGPDALYARKVLFEAMDAALDELPKDQRDVYVAHEFLGKSFAELSTETGVGVNTLLSRKRYAVLHLRKRLQEMDERFGR
jgi:RNA polymerase sigma factor (sigma-70 family)